MIRRATVAVGSRWLARRGSAPAPARPSVRPGPVASGRRRRPRRPGGRARRRRRSPAGRRRCRAGEPGGGTRDPDAGRARPPTPPVDAQPADPGAAAPRPATPAGRLPRRVWARRRPDRRGRGGAGAFVRLGQGATVVPLAMRNAPLIEGRPLFVRVHLATEAGFAARPLRGVLTLEQGEARGTSRRRKMIAGASSSERLDSTFNFLVPAELMKPGTRLWSRAPRERPAAPRADPRAGDAAAVPATGAVELGVKAGRMVLDLVLVPAIGVGGPSTTRRPGARAWRTTCTTSTRSRSSTCAGASRCALPPASPPREGFAALSEARDEDGATPNEYYHLMIARADTREAYLGIANFAGAGARDGARRIGITFLRPAGGRRLGGQHLARDRPQPRAQPRPQLRRRRPRPRLPLRHGRLGVDGISLSEGVFYRAAGALRHHGVLLADLDQRLHLARPRAAGARGQRLRPRRRHGPGRARALQAFVSPGEAPLWNIAPGSLATPTPPAPPPAGARLTLADGTPRRPRSGAHPLRRPHPRAGHRPAPGGGRSPRSEVVLDGARYAVPATVLGRRYIQR